jgi:hypothetical protein
MCEDTGRLQKFFRIFLRFGSFPLFVQSEVRALLNEVKFWKNLRTEMILLANVSTQSLC